MPCSTFHVKISFTGICALVPDKPFDQQPKQVCMVLPDAFFQDVDPRVAPKAADASLLRRHRAMVQFPLHNIPGLKANKTAATAVWYIEKQRLTFSATGASALTIGDLSRVLDLGTIANGFDIIDPEHLKPYVITAGATQVLLDAGHLTQGLVPTLVWKVTPSVLSPKTIYTTLAHDVVLTMSNVTSFKMVARPREGGSPVEQELTADDGATIALTVAHLCEDNPLLWETKNFAVIDDIDTKWYFKLLSLTDQGKLLSALDGNELPIPRPTSSGGQGVDCSPAKAAPASF